MPQLHSNPPPPPDGSDSEDGQTFKHFGPSGSAARLPWRAGDLPGESPTRQFDALFVLPVKRESGALHALQELLREASLQTLAHMRDPLAQREMLLPFHELGTVHYARLILLEPEHGLGARLVIATDFDGPEGDAKCSRSAALAGHLRQITQSARLAAGLDRLFRYCEGYDKPADLMGFLRQHTVRARTAYVGAPGRSVKQILWERELRRQIEELLTQHAGTAEALREVVRAQLGSLPSFPAQPDFSKRMKRNMRLLKLAGVAVGAGVVTAAVSGGPLGLALSSAGVLGVGLTYVYFRRKEDTDPQFQITNDARSLAALERASEEENHFPQNPLTHLVEIKPGLMRAALIRVVFAAVQYRATYLYNKGKLGEIPSIHFARWALIGPRHVLFLSNFDSSWQSYLGDFIDKASAGLTAVWSNTVGYPRTKRLLRAGSRDAARFLAWTRANQRPTALWYCAYPGLSIVNVNDNTAIRRGIADPACMDAESWLFRLRSVDRAGVDTQRSEQQADATPLALDRVQGIILRGYGHMPEARYVMLRVPDGAGKAALEWLSALDLTNAEEGSRARAKPEPFINVAFTHTGLRQLGVDEAVCQSFAPAFVQGSHHPQRARVNGDVGQNDPGLWSWGNQAQQVDLLLLVYAKTRTSVEAEVQKLLGSAQLHGLTHVVTLEGTELPGRKEHFGFRDGIGQPVVRGLGGSDLEDDALAAGELLLGHRDAYGNVSHAPASARGFSLGHDGSYLVFRQLEQRVADFWNYCAAQQGPEAAVRVASKLVGRWPSGASLVRHPDADPDDVRFQDEDDFSYLANDEDNDRYGARCPFGSHIRRANPRDWALGPTREESLQLSNLHRIMRRGRPYGQPLAAEMKASELLAAAQRGDDAGARGLQFLCFNANIDRQFEFIQQHWCNNPHFAGLDNSPDPLIGCPLSASAGSSKPGFTPQTDVRHDAPQRYSELQSFVRVVGSAYFFMPSIAAVKLLAQGQFAPQLKAAPESVPPDESLHVERLLNAMRRKMIKDFPEGRMGRGTHAKMHGCLEASFRVEPDVAAKLFGASANVPAEQLGLFGEPREYNAWVRFSNQRPNEADQKADLRAVAIKLRDVAGVKLLDGEEHGHEHDFIMISLDAFLAKNVEDFAAFVEALVDHKWRVLPFLLTHPGTLRQMLRVRLSRGALLERSYFSAVPYALGAHAVKYSLRPSRELGTSELDANDPNCLRKDLQDRLSRESFSFDFLVQVQGDPKAMPVEDAGVVWKAPFVKVATLELPIQHFDTPQRDAFGENLSFNPWRCLPAHRPLGGLNRARRQIYRALARFRHDRNAVETDKR